MRCYIRPTVRGEVSGEGVDVFLASRERNERWWLPISDGAAHLGTPRELEFFPSHPAYSLLPLPYPVG